MSCHATSSLDTCQFFLVKTHHWNYSISRHVSCSGAQENAHLKALGTTNLLCKYADDTTLLVQEVCDVKIEDELDNIIRWSIANKLELNLGKSKEIVLSA